MKVLRLLDGAHLHTNMNRTTPVWIWLGSDWSHACHILRHIRFKRSYHTTSRFPDMFLKSKPISTIRPTWYKYKPILKTYGLSCYNRSSLAQPQPWPQPDPQ